MTVSAHELRVMVDMSATLFHHGHVRLLKAASEIGYVIVALTSDAEVEAHKGYKPELDYEMRKEVLEAIRYVDEVVPCNWLIEESFLNQYCIDLLLHGADNSNPISPQRLKILPRTPGISSSLLRARVLRAAAQIIGGNEID
ncbi:adenylyltransferase/cytidyltransferase family protein [Pseudolabrys sp.]|uniref:adenylyltransferase/cytidyltransferase family protein n=1 Tax=Pseudolabrys sp. TaxID=1960880 RepID=UPI003D1218C2